MTLLTLLLAFQTPVSAPAAAPECQLQDRHFYLACYDADRKISTWVSYVLKDENLTRQAARPASFHQDRELAQPRATNNDYKGSGFHRCHIAPARDFAYSDEAIQSTFSLINAVPCFPALNTGRWAQLENPSSKTTPAASPPATTRSASSPAQSVKPQPSAKTKSPSQPTCSRS